MMKQLRQTGGFLLEHNDFHMYVDPGPGALVHGLKNGVDFEDIGHLFCSHDHLDHYGDLAAVIEATTNGCTEECGTLIAPESVLGLNEYDSVLQDYHLDCTESKVRAAEGEEFNPSSHEEISLSFFETRHKDTPTAGFRLETEESSLSYIPDTGFFEGLIEEVRGSDFLVINTMRPYDKPWEDHLNLKEGAEIVRKVEPERAIFQHFGISFVYNFGAQKKWLEENYEKDNIVLASDNKTYNLGENGGLERFVD